MKAVANREVCVGAGMCVLNAPACYDQDDNGTVVVIQAEVPPGDEQAVRDAADTCPSGAISYED